GLRQAVDSLLEDAVGAAEDRAVARQQELRVVLLDAYQRLDELRQVVPESLFPCLSGCHPKSLRV
ncbi:MAG: hypothetical protein AAB658_19620, partial [Chloroflexota bacterium]